MNYVYDSDAAFVSITVLIAVIGLAIKFFYLKNLSDLLLAIREPNRHMAPGAVWLILLSILGSLLSLPIYFLKYDYRMIAKAISVLSYLISIFVIIWNFRMVRAIADSIEAEYDSRNIPIEHRPSYQTGMFMSISAAVTLLNDVPYIGMIGKLAGLGYMIGLITYWIRTHKFKKEIQAMSVHQDEDSLIFKDLM